MPPEPWSRSENPMPPLQPAESQAEARQAMGLGADCLRLELMQMFEEGRPRLRPTPIKARHFVSTTLNGKALYESHKCEVESRWRDSAHEFLSVKDGFLSPPPMLIIERADSECLSETSSSTSGFESSDPSGSEASSSPPSTSPIPSPPQTTVQRVIKPRCKVTVALRLHSPTMSPIREDTPSPTPPRNIESPGRRNSHARNGYHRYISGIAPKEINGSRKTDDDDEDADGLGIWSFHLNEHDDVEEARDSVPTFAGCRSLVAPEAAIKGKTGTVRGVRNRVRAGIATFLQGNGKRYTHTEAGKVVVYVTTLGIIRETFQQCLAVRTILRTLLVHFEEKDVFLCRGYQAELLDRLGHQQVVVPQVFLEGQHLGDAETIERLNEAGKLRKILRPYKRLSCSLPCSQCGGYRLLPCKSCNGSKKSIHRNHFTEEFMALRCMQCDESGLMRCTACIGKPC